jgi:hypothetical protein|tara:strand:- start:1777 stop:2238 length:462 start_codon:yes stop_codon:yes gene_type:complete
MTPPSKWLFFPTQATGGANITITGNLAADTTSGNSSVNLNNWAISGSDAADFDEYTSTAYRRQSGYGYLELLIRVDTTATYSSSSNFDSSVTLDSSNSSITVGGSTFSQTNFLLVAAGSDILRFRFWGSSSDITPIWNNGSSGDLITVNLAWT